jgi:hypothetical protein
MLAYLFAPRLFLLRYKATYTCACACIKPVFNSDARPHIYLRLCLHQACVYSYAGPLTLAPVIASSLCLLRCKASYTCACDCIKPVFTQIQGLLYLRLWLHQACFNSDSRPLILLLTSSLFCFTVKQGLSSQRAFTFSTKTWLLISRINFPCRLPRVNRIVCNLGQLYSTRVTRIR